VYFSYCWRFLPSQNQSLVIRRRHPALYFSVKIQIQPDLNNLTSCIDELHVWFCVNDTALNPDKSEAILLGTQQQSHSYSNLASVNISEDMAKMVACVFVNSHLNYATSVLYGTTKKNISKLQKAQNLLARVVTGSSQPGLYTLLQ